MTPKIKRYYEASLKDVGFQKEVVLADPNDTPPKWYSSRLEKELYALLYYGYMIGKYGADHNHAMENNL